MSCSWVDGVPVGRSADTNPTVQFSCSFSSVAQYVQGDAGRCAKPSCRLSGEPLQPELWSFYFSKFFLLLLFGIPSFFIQTNPNQTLGPL